MQLGVVLIVAGILMGLPTALYRQSRPRKAGEPFGAVRAALLSLSLAGMLLVLTGASFIWASP